MAPTSVGEASPSWNAALLRVKCHFQILPAIFPPYNIRSQTKKRMVGGRSGEISKGPIVCSFGEILLFFCLRSNKEPLNNVILDNYGQPSIFLNDKYT